MAGGFHAGAFVICQCGCFSMITTGSLQKGHPSAQTARLYYNRFAMLPLLPVLVFLMQVSPDAKAPPKIDFVRAKRVFETSCAGCHGPEGRGGKGPSLAVPKLRRAATDEDLGLIILNGIPGTEMPPSWYLGGEGVTLAAAYVRMLGAIASPPKIVGDLI